MRFCLSANVDDKYLEKANELKVDYSHRSYVDKIHERYQDKYIVLQHTAYDEPIDWNELKQYNALTHHQLILCLSTIADCVMAKELGFEFYYGYPIKTLYEANALKEMGVRYIRLGVPLLFQMKDVKNINIPVRLVPNIAYNDGMIRNHSWDGGFVRPEDLHYYEDYVDIVEFEDCDIYKEEALFRIYAEQQEWPGDINMIITNIQETGILNRLLPPDFGSYRLNCQHRCQKNECRLCSASFKLASMIEELKEYKEKFDI